MRAAARGLPRARLRRRRHARHRGRRRPVAAATCITTSAARTSSSSSARIARSIGCSTRSPRRGAIAPAAAGAAARHGGRARAVPARRGRGVGRAPRGRRAAAAAARAHRRQARSLRARRPRARRRRHQAPATLRTTDATIATRAFLGALNWTAHWFRPEGPQSPSTIAELVADYAVAGLTNPHDARNVHLALTVNGEADRSRVRAVQDAARGAARGPEPVRHQARLRARRVRRLRGAARRPAGALVPGARRRVRRPRRHDRRGAGRPTAGSIRCRTRSPISAPRSAATARPGFSSPRRRCSTSIRIRRAIRSRRRSPAACAAAPAISRSSKRSKPRSSARAAPQAPAPR